MLPNRKLRNVGNFAGVSPRENLDKIGVIMRCRREAVPMYDGVRMPVAVAGHARKAAAKQPADAVRLLRTDALQRAIAVAAPFDYSFLEMALVHLMPPSPGCRRAPYKSGGEIPSCRRFLFGGGGRNIFRIPPKIGANF